MAYVTDAAREYAKKMAKDNNNEANLKNYIRKNFHWTLISPSTDIFVEFKNNYAYITMNDEYDDKFIFALKIDDDAQFKNWQAINLIIKDSNNKLLLNKKFSNNETLKDIEDVIIDTLDMSYEVNGIHHKVTHKETTNMTDAAREYAKKMAKDAPGPDFDFLNDPRLAYETYIKAVDEYNANAKKANEYLEKLYEFRYIEENLGIAHGFANEPHYNIGDQIKDGGSIDYLSKMSFDEFIKEQKTESSQYFDKD